MTGTVRCKLYKGNVIVVGRKSPFTLYNQVGGMGFCIAYSHKAGLKCFLRLHYCAVSYSDFIIFDRAAPCMG